MADEDALQTLGRMLDRIYADRRSLPRMEIISTAETMSLPEDVLAIFGLLPPGDYTRRRLVDQLNSAIVAQGRGYSLGTLD